MARIFKPVSFNTKTEAKLLEFANSINFSAWVKTRIKAELELGIDPAIAAYIERFFQVRLAQPAPKTQPEKKIDEDQFW
jgi:hypothetical protein